MIRLVLKLAFAAAALWAVWAFVPVHGRTLEARWRAAGDLSTFVERGLAEVTRSGPPKPQARRPRASGAREQPTEGVSDADRAAVDRLLSERLSGKP